MSFLNIEEILFTLNCSPLNGRLQLNLLLDIADSSRFIVSQDMVVNEVIRAYALGAKAHTPFGICDRNKRRFLKRMTKTTSLPRDILQIIEQTRAAKQEFKSKFEQGKAKLVSLARELGGKGYPFAKYFENNTVWLAESLADRAGVLADCRAKGMAGLMEEKVVRMAVGANLSLIYSHDFEGRTPKNGDSRDVLHAVLASTSEVFVTHDSELTRVLQRVPLADFQITNIHALLEKMR